jgi:hypothetical protein
MPGRGAVQSEWLLLSRAKVERDLAWSLGFLIGGLALSTWGLLFVFGLFVGAPSLAGAAGSTYFWLVELVHGVGTMLVLPGALFTGINARLLRQAARPSAPT